MGIGRDIQSWRKSHIILDGKSDIKKLFNFIQKNLIINFVYFRALAILDKGLEFIPLSVDLWLSYLSLFKEVNAHQPNFESLVRK